MLCHTSANQREIHRQYDFLDYLDAESSRQLRLRRESKAITGSSMKPISGKTCTGQSQGQADWRMHSIIRHGLNLVASGLSTSCLSRRRRSAKPGRYLIGHQFDGYRPAASRPVSAATSGPRQLGPRRVQCPALFLTGRKMPRREDETGHRYVLVAPIDS